MRYIVRAGLIFSLAFLVFFIFIGTVVAEEVDTIITTDIPTLPRQKKIALTFDDGPDQRNTQKILDILREENVSATFFVVGNRVERYPEILIRIFDDGHLIANHSRTHADLTTLTNEEILALELAPTSKAVEKLTGYYPMIMRPPWGSLRVDSVSFLRDLGWQIVRWSLDTFDWDSSRNQPEEIISRIQAQHHPNAIVLMHCNGPATIKVLPDVISTLRDLGYDFVTVDQL
ncbi:MAG: polysaccharide deacetylase family protein [Firmicutes bacterium]|jgi:peptidoglycan/xylan/chitin deacetylase (PgdA/CDA1 family)|nr:polysaccharide deacetylase family protein [Bacillota bacterium]